MTRFLLDTNVLSELRRTKPHGAVVSWLQGLRKEQVFLSVVTLGELQAGVERTRKHDPVKAAQIESWAALMAESYHVLPMDTACFREWARLMDGKQSEVILDAMIAATANIHDLTVATRNVRDFELFDVTLLNPFEGHA